MNRNDILDALNEISDARIAKAATPPKTGTGRIYWYSGVAAVLAIAILLGVLLPSWGKLPAQMFNPTVNPPTLPTFESTPTQKPTVTPTVAPTIAPTLPGQTPASGAPTTAPTQPSVTEPDVTLSTCPGFLSLNSDCHACGIYPLESKKVEVSDYLAELGGYFTRTMRQFLQDDNENTAFSPLNLYMALAMLAETTDGSTRAEILDLLAANDLNALRQRTNALWNSAYKTGNNPCLPANSVWLQEGDHCYGSNCVYKPTPLSNISKYYYANVYGIDFRNPEAVADIGRWINKKTENFLQEQVSELTFDPKTILALVSTVYLDAKWSKPFEQEFNTESVFGGTKGWTPCTYMNRHMISDYYSGADFGAVSLSLKDGYKMWFVLPNAGQKPADLLDSGDYTKLFLGGGVRKELAQINLSVPKFDIACKQNMIEGLQSLGIQRVFTPGADFSPLTDIDLFVNKVEQATRVNVNETGVTAASFVVISGPTSPEPPQLVVDFVLNRPFLFVITNNQNLPLFAGCVNNP